MKKTVIFSFLFSIYSFILSYILLSFYIGGDQVHYINFYESISEYDFVSGYLFYNGALGSQEPIYYLIVYFLNGLFAKNLLFSLINAGLAYCLAYLLLEKRNFFPFGLFPLALNFYLIVLFTGAERLKVSLFFLLLYFMVYNKKVKSLLLLSSVFAHIQTFILLISVQVNKMLPLFKRLLLKGRINYKLFGIMGSIVLLGFAFLFIQEHITSKLTAYVSFGGLKNIIKPIFFLIITLPYSRDRKLESVLMHLPLVIASFFIGDIRIVIFSYFVFFYYASSVKRGLNLGILISSIYFLIKGINFIYFIFQYGNGFADLA